MDFVTRFEELCSQTKQTPSAVGAQLGVSRATVSRWRSGKDFPKTKTLQRIANYFGVSVDYLLGKSDIRNADAEFENMERAKLLLFNTDSVPEKAWREVVKFVEYTKKKYEIG